MSLRLLFLSAGKYAVFEPAHQLVGLFGQTQGQDLERELAEARLVRRCLTYGMR
jgi:hypothetical protein